MSYITNITPPCAKPCVLTLANIRQNELVTLIRSRNTNTTLALSITWIRRNAQVVSDILHIMRVQGRELDYNMSGFFKPDCREMYPSRFIQGMAAIIGVPFVLGSDAHSIADIEKIWG